MDEIQNYLEDIEEFVTVEDKIVTYKFVCKALKVHVNKAKELLKEFALLPDNSAKISMTYLIGGEKEDGRFKFVLVDSKEVENVKKKFEKVVSEHVYSVQRSSPLSATDLYNADSFEMLSEDKKFSSICGNDDIKIREPKYMPVKKEEPKKIEAKKVEPLKPVQEVQKTEQKTEIKTEKKSPVKPKKTQKKNTPQNNLSTMFSRQAALPKKEKKEDIKEAKENIKAEKIESPKIKKTENKKKRKKNTDNNKTRKRIRIASDSESNDEMDVEVEEAPPVIEEEETAKPVESDDDVIPPTPVAKGRKRVRKQVDNTFVDDDGFMITKKEYVYESCSDTEEPEVPAKIGKPDDKKLKETEKLAEKTEKSPKEQPEKEEKTEKLPKEQKEKVEKTKKSPKEEKPKKQTKAKAKSSPKKNQPSIMKFFQKK